MKHKFNSKKIIVSVLLLFLIIPLMPFEDSHTLSYTKYQIDTSMFYKLNLNRIYNTTTLLSSYNTRETGTFECNLAAADIYTRLNSTYNLSNVFYELFTYNSTSCFNVVGRINGTNLKDEIIVICAHYDSISMDENAPGANDNAVAVATCMEVMGVIRNNFQLNRTLIFVAFAGEEQAFIGSQAWVTQHDAELPKVVAVLNLDMIGVGNQLRVLKNEQYEWLADIVIFSSSAVNITFRKSNSLYPENSRFDHDTFWLAQVPCVTLFEAGAIYPYYHTSDDTIDKISFSLVEKCAQVTLASVVYLGTSVFLHNPTYILTFIWVSWAIAAVFLIIIFTKGRKLFLISPK
ncbi:MAG: M28 family metallopeptidase [Candidatus Helarchaeota archaeon]